MTSPQYNATGLASQERQTGAPYWRSDEFCAESQLL